MEVHFPCHWDTPSLILSPPLFFPVRLVSVKLYHSTSQLLAMCWRAAVWKQMVLKRVIVPSVTCFHSLKILMAWWLGDWCGGWRKNGPYIVVQYKCTKRKIKTNLDADKRRRKCRKLFVSILCSMWSNCFDYCYNIKTYNTAIQSFLAQETKSVSHCKQTQWDLQ